MIETSRMLSKTLTEEILSKAAKEIRVEGPGIECLDNPGPKIIATTHLTDIDLQYAVLALTKRLGGLENIRIAHSSSHRSWQRPELKALTSLTETIIGKNRILPISHRFNRKKDLETKKQKISEQGYLNPKDWQEIVSSLQNGEVFFTTAYYNDRNYFVLPKSGGYLPLILKNHVPNAELIPVIVLHPPEVYEKRENFPKTKPKIIVCEPLELTTLNWSSTKQIRQIFPNFQAKPIDFFDIVLKKDKRMLAGLSKKQKKAMREEFRHISKQLKEQSRQLMSALTNHIPEALKPNQ